MAMGFAEYDILQVLIHESLPFIAESVRAYREAVARGRDPQALEQLIVDHIQQLPALLRAV